MKTSFVATILNEESSVDVFVKSILSQSKKIGEIIIVDGSSTDKTLEKLNRYKNRIRIFKKNGNRSVGRNYGITKAKGDIILVSDAGCILDSKWAENIIKPFKDKNVDVVAGYYKGKANSIFQKCLIPYVLVMPDKINPQNFLPASRSMAFKKSIWEKIGGFPEEFSHNEDYVFSKKLKNFGVKKVFNKDAIVYWLPRENLKETFRMFYRFAFGDAESGIFRPKVILLFARYLVGSYLLLLSFVSRSSLLFHLVVFSFLLYIMWTNWKNYRYVRKYKALFFLPILQATSDLAVLAGTTFGFLKKFSFKKVSQVIIRNKGVSLIIGAYIVLMVILINWGIPNKNHPFDYFMDEWHQAQAVRTVATLGTPNVAGSANGSMFHFFLTGLYLIPFVVLGIVNPFAIEGSVSSLDIQHRLFQILRLNTLLFGIGSIILIAYIGKKYFKLHPFLISFLFVVNPIWLSLSNYFKYDIALVFWILLSFLFLLKYLDKPSVVNASFASFLSGLSLAVKVSALPLFALIIVVFGFVHKEKIKKISHILLGMIIYIGTFILFGIPDLVLGRGDIREYLYDNLVRTPGLSTNYNLGMNYVQFILTRIIPTAFGLSFFFLIIVSIPMTVFLSRKNKHYQLLLLTFFLFILSLLPLRIEARTNRLLVLLPFFALSSGILIESLLKLKYARKIFIACIFLILCFQLVESFSWVAIKFHPDPRETASTWIAKNILQRTTIGIENIPIYQSLPNILLKDFYEKQYYPETKTRFTYRILDTSVPLQSYVVITNEKTETDYLKNSSKKNVIKRLEKEGYKKIHKDEFNLYPLTFFRNDLDFFMSGLVQSPLSISVYKKGSNK